MRKQVLAILSCAKEQGVQSYFGEAKQKAAVRKLAAEGIVKIVGEEKEGKIKWLIARFA